ncbi:hypothetical protein RCO27_13640 [Sphingosinicella sp. LHD-64]|uniref:hypothetical protein n=1 Tax=Sphingosinicella sp. LHD-64 TaxID=3072139 RepID=UPI00280F00CF|nr:hypothetical protein [Sphingosinicella sp. LHD-64]MDQ8757268.1 hypothetical protein [Sphingosinicella sp. LHD-64]
MNGLALQSNPVRLPIPSIALERHRTLTVYGLAMLALGAVAIALQVLDPRTLASGIGIWVKPAKFFISIGVFALTAAWFFGYVRPERRGSIAMRATAATLIAAGTFELAYICFQAAQGLESHFNVDSLFHVRMYQLMGVGAVLLVGTTLPMAWEIARRPAAGLQRSFVAAVVIGLVLTFLLGGGLGGYMSSQAGHAVGAQGGHVALFGWNRLGGDLRVAHFLGIHAEQAMPLLAALVAGAPARTRWLVLVAGTIAYTAVTLAVFAQAVAGQPLIPA